MGRVIWISGMGTQICMELYKTISRHLSDYQIIVLKCLFDKLNHYEQLILEKFDLQILTIIADHPNSLLINDELMQTLE